MIHRIRNLLTEALKSNGYEYPEDTLIAEPPSHVAADFAVNVALQVARAVKGNPREIAEKLRESLLQTEEFADIEISGPGFLNVHLTDASYKKALQELEALPSTGVPATDPKKIVVEYISANPTGPLHIGNARGGPLGETIARVLQAKGHNVHRDFYVNDIGGQANKFACTVLHFYKLAFDMESEAPECGYPEHVVSELVAEIVTNVGDRLLHLPADQQEEAMRVVAIDRQVKRIQATAARMGIHFDTWSTQGEVVASGRTASALGILEERGSTFEKEGAIWLNGEMHETDRETVLVKSDKTTTYFLDDIAFYRMKLEEWGNDYAVCVLGPGHLDHIARMKAGLSGVGIDPDRYHGTIYQNVQLKQDGVKVKMAKRDGNFVTADQVLDEIPRDVFTWFMLSKAPETHLDFDLQLAKDTSEKNPIYYVQYAHARICSVLAKVETEPTGEKSELNKEERALVRHLATFGKVIDEVAETYRTHLIPTYLYELATRYHHFYAHHRVIADTPEETMLRVELSKLTAKALKEGLNLLNIEAQSSM
jgi:arginyl-tRNA synthetase